MNQTLEKKVVTRAEYDEALDIIISTRHCSKEDAVILLDKKWTIKSDTFED